MKRKLLLIGIGIVLALIFFSNPMKIAIIRVNVLVKTDLKEINTVTPSTVGRPLFLAIGTNRKGEKTAVWMNKQSFFSYGVEGKASLENTIEKDKAISIIKENNLLNNFQSIELQYCMKNSYLREGAYWYSGDFSGDNHNYRIVYIDIVNGKYIVLDDFGKVIIDTIK
ncbi:hypothetical protein [Clostridium omnivorum]|uniref:DUF5590 domain-containing protein n=1 Tax=Clostridium omnivorum TaxID=1604902 RepID=A0ABQ5N5W2_9CLOT|nr:hypothetical protein [Clostridium sp. E14]GLC30627.1 hypothetical protein bsdE14_20370 [Clostridium sp. E14]